MAPAAMPTAKPIMKPILTLSKQLGCVCPYGPTVTGIWKMDADFIFLHHAMFLYLYSHMNYLKIYIMTLLCNKYYIYLLYNIYTCIFGAFRVS